MDYHRSNLLFTFISLLLLVNGCRSSNPSQGGFAVSTAERTQAASGALSPPRFIPNVHVSGNFTGTITGEQPYGTTQSYDGIEGNWFAAHAECGAPNDYNSNNYYWVCYGEAPATWTITFDLSYLCGTKNLVYELPFSDYRYQLTDQEVFLTSGIEGDCFTPYLPPASTRFAILGQLPQTLTLSGEAPFVTTYGMPELYIYDGTATLVTTETATSVSGDGSQATFPFPSSLQQNGYTVAVVNQTGDSQGISAVGTNYLSIASSQTISGNPFGVAVNALTETIQTCHWYPGHPPILVCSPPTSNYSASPLIALYSQNQVLIGGTAVTVGANPTAVVTYNGGVVHRGWSPNTDDFTGTTRAIVADSGTNLVSILDTVQDRLLENVIVGNQPVALAVSSDGTKAYVANYADSTVTQVNLTAGTVLATIPVGGQPTSVALTSGGTLWVGGVGFLTEVSTENMSVVATESTAGKTITALAYSDGQNELVATTANNGSMSIDELNPTAVQPGGTYTPLASHSVSTTFGTYYNPRLQANVQGYTATVTTSTVPINTNVPGAPPLVVQDGWAVVTATPTGFTITDASGHVVLVSETTPSPIAAIAVDNNLNVAYLTMPDSNTLLTVPLPGTGSN